MATLASAEGLSEHQKYLTDTNLLALLEMGLEACLADQYAKGGGSGEQPLTYLATWLMRNNPKHSEQGRELLEKFQEALLTRQELADMSAMEGKLADEAAMKLQAAHRGHTARLMAGEQKKAARVVQSGMRGRKARKEREAMNAAATNVAAHVKGHQARREIQEMRDAELAAQQAAATAVQKVIRGHTTRAMSAPARRAGPDEAAERAAAAAADESATAEAAQGGAPDEAEQQQAAATRVQASVRGHQSRAARE